MLEGALQDEAASTSMAAQRPSEGKAGSEANSPPLSRSAPGKSASTLSRSQPRCAAAKTPNAIRRIEPRARRA